MISRDQLVAIISSLDTGSLIDMLAAKGIKLADPQAVLDADEGGQSALESWNQRTIPVKQDARPSLMDKNYLDVEQPKAQVQRPSYLDGESDMLTEFANDEDDGGAY